MKTLREKKHDNFVCIMEEVRKKKQTSNRRTIPSLIDKIITRITQLAK